MPQPAAASALLDELSARFGDELVKLDGYDDCILGVVTRFGSLPILCYDREKVIARLMESDMTRTDAEEYFAFNIESWVGERTPCFLETSENPGRP